MESITVEILRYGGPEGILSRGNQYLVTSGSQPVRTCTMQLDQAGFLDLLAYLRYERGLVGISPRQALQKLGKIAWSFLRPPVPSVRLTQIDLVASAAELWAFPFEAISGSDEHPLLLDAERPLVLTRRIRQSFASRTPTWPSEPRILFACACPAWAGMASVPFEEHKDALRKALSPWIEPLQGYPHAVPDERNVLRILERASLDDIEKACRDARNGGKPFTHVHILAHGVTVDERGMRHRERFALALESRTGSPTMAEDLARVLKPVAGMPAIVTLAACDAANESNSIVATGSIAQKLHLAGVPVVVASQLPMTGPGSVALAERFYGSQLAGSDVRQTLHEVRTALSITKDAGHDWASLVAYVQLPEGYEEHVFDAALRADLASLKTAQCWSDFIVQNEIDDTAAFDWVGAILQKRIETLENRIEKTREEMSTRGTKPRSGVFEEMVGLLGSAYKRLAELQFVRAAKAGAAATEWLRKSRAALTVSLKAYREGCEYNLSHHWTAVQRLCLEAVLDGTIADSGYWHAALKAAELDWHKNGNAWGLGSIVELCLLGPLSGQADMVDRGCKALADMRQWASKPAIDRFPVESTARQLLRYVRWWTRANGYFPGRNEDLASSAERMLREIG